MPFKKGEVNSPGRPKGGHNKRTNLKDVIEIAGDLPSDTIAKLLRNKQLTIKEKLAILADITRSEETNNSDRIRAIDAHTALSGETSEGLKKYQIRVFVIPPDIKDPDALDTYMKTALKAKTIRG